jgi:hypothetical protein
MSVDLATEAYKRLEVAVLMYATGLEGAVAPGETASNDIYLQPFAYLLFFLFTPLRLRELELTMEIKRGRQRLAVSMTWLRVYIHYSLVSNATWSRQSRIIAFQKTILPHNINPSNAMNKSREMQAGSVGVEGSTQVGLKSWEDPKKVSVYAANTSTNDSVDG